MKKLTLHIMASISSIWLIDLLLSGFVFKKAPVTTLWVILFIIGGSLLLEMLLKKVYISSKVVLFILAVCINFFILYIASIVLMNFQVNPGTFKWLNVNLVKSMDQILTLLIGSAIITFFSSLTKWASSNN